MAAGRGGLRVAKAIEEVADHLASLVPRSCSPLDRTLRVACEIPGLTSSDSAGKQSS